MMLLEAFFENLRNNENKKERCVAPFIFSIFTGSIPKNPLRIGFKRRIHGLLSLTQICDILVPVSLYLF